MDSLLPDMDNPMDSLLHQTMATLLNNKDPLSFILTMTMMMALPASIVATTPTISPEGKLDALQLLGDAACSTSQVFCAAFLALWTGAKMWSLFV